MNCPLRLTVLGTGYLGMIQAARTASMGFDVPGVDTEPAKVGRLNAGHLPIYKPGLTTLLRVDLNSGRLMFATSYPQAVASGAGCAS